MRQPLLIALIPLLPLVAGAVCAISMLAGRPLAEARVRTLTLLSMALALVGSLAVFTDVMARPEPRRLVFAPWLESGDYRVSLELLIDPLAAAMMLLVTAFCILIAVFSSSYMHRESGFGRFYAVLCLFTAEMLLLVMGGNLVMTFIGWEGVGLCSYLLIGFYYDRRAPASAGTRAFVTNRIGDAGFLAAIFLSFGAFGAVDYTSIAARAGAADTGAVTAIGLCLLAAAAAKSGQLPLSPWLARAMEGPTPSSALFYAAVMVNAGVYLLVRAHPVLDAAPAATLVVAMVGGATALYGTMVGLVQTDVKSGLIFSTMSQLGLMFVACGLRAYGVAVFHMIAHALVRCSQFLLAPSALGRIPRAAPERVRSLSADIHPGAWLLLTGAIGVLLLPLVPDGRIGVGSPPSRAAYAIYAAGAVALYCSAHYAAQFARATLDDKEGSDGGRAGSTKEGARAAGGLPGGRALLGALPAAAAAVGAALEILPGGAPGSWFHRFLSPSIARAGTLVTGAGDAAGEAPLSLAMPALVIVGAILLAGWSTALYFHRARPERAGVVLFRLRGLYAPALHRFWLEEIDSRVVIRPLLRIANLLDRIDSGIIDRAMGRARPAPRVVATAAWEAQLLAGEVSTAAAPAGHAAARTIDFSGRSRQLEIGRGSGLAGRLTQGLASLVHSVERFLFGTAIGRGIPTTGKLLGRVLTRVEALLERPPVAGLLMLACVIAALKASL